MSRLVCWFSAGVTSAVATKIAVDRYRNQKEIHVIYCDTGSEHEDNKRFIRECSEWIGVDITVKQADAFKSIWDVFEKTRYLVGPKGARCTAELKKRIRNDFQHIDDLQVFGFDRSEEKRIKRFKENNPEVNLCLPLYENNLSKQDCIDMVLSAGIDIPAMYRLGYKNNNCIGCVKGQMGYWNKIRKDFPDTFAKMAKQERRLGIAICKTYVGGKRTKVFLDELEPDKGCYESELEIKCGLICGE